MRYKLLHLHMNAFCFVGVLLLAGVSGCSSGGVQLGTVTGHITKNGKPQPKISIYMTPLDHGRASEGLTDTDGNYQMVYTRDLMGALVGKHRLLISGAPKMGRNDELISEGKELLSTDVEVHSGSNTFDFDLATSGDQKAK
jgi:hypothetical protein